MPTVAELTTKALPNWCLACGDFNILFALKNALAELNIPREQTVVVSGIGCLPPEEVVSVGNEWIPISELKSNEMIVNGEGNFTSILFKTINEFEGDMLEIVPFVSPFNSIKLTPEHPVLCVRRNSIRSRNQVDKKKLSSIKPDFADAGSLKKGDYLIFNWNKEVKDNPDFTTEFCRLLGYYLAEGWINEGGGRNRDSANVSFALNIDEKDIIEDIASLSIKLTGRKPYIREREHIGKAVEVTIRSKELALLFKKIAGKGAGNKKLAEEIMLLPQKKQKEIIEAYLRGDGHPGIAKLGKNKYFRANTPSLSLAIQVQELLARQGIFASLYKKKMRPHNYMIAFQPEKEFSSVQKTKYGFLIPIKKINKSPYKGIVHNLETKTNPHSYLVKGFVVHNCGSKTPHFLTTYGFEGLHGRSLAVATGAKLVNPELNVIITAGDGDCYGIGGNHLIHSMRRNIDITLIVQNNAVYGLTKGQYSPTSRKGFKTPSSPQGALEEPINPMALGIIMGATYVARGFAYEIQHLIKLVKGAIEHKGFSIVDIFQPCSTYNKVQTLQWYKENIKKLEDMGHDPSNKTAALEKAMLWEPGNVPIGLFYKEEKPTYDEQAGRAVVKDDISNIDIREMLAKAK